MRLPRPRADARCRAGRCCAAPESSGQRGWRRRLLSTQVALAAPDYTGDTVIVLSMRGGFDGLSAVVPYGDPAYAGLRSHNTAVPQAQLLAGTTDGYFGLHPSFAPLKPYWDSGSFGVVHACGLWAPDRSHFEAQAEMERAAPGTSARSGWLDRVIGINGLTGSSFQAVQVGDTLPPDSLLGPNPELAMDNLDGFRLSGASSTADRLAAGTRPSAPCTATLADGSEAADVHHPRRHPDGGWDGPGQGLRARQRGGLRR